MPKGNRKNNLSVSDKKRKNTTLFGATKEEVTSFNGTLRKSNSTESIKFKKSNTKM